MEIRLTTVILRLGAALVAASGRSRGASRRRRTRTRWSSLRAWISKSLESDNLNTTQSINIASHLWATLLQVTPDGEVKPSLAESYSWNAAGTELTFKIRAGQTCENGEPLTAEDVVYSLKRQVDPALGFKGNVGSFVYPTIGFVDARLDGEDLATVIVKKYQSIAPGMLAQAYIKCKGAYETMTRPRRPRPSSPPAPIGW